MKERLQRIREEAIEKIKASKNPEALNDVRVSILGKKGELTRASEDSICFKASALIFSNCSFMMFSFLFLFLGACDRAGRIFPCSLRRGGAAASGHISSPPRVHKKIPSINEGTNYFIAVPP